MEKGINSGVVCVKVKYMKLQKFIIEKYKRINKATIDFSKDSDNITVLAGQNESGKSSLLEALETFYQEAFSDDSVPMLKDEFKDKQSATFNFIFDTEDIDVFCEKLTHQYPGNDEFFSYLKIELKRTSLLKEIIFYLKSNKEDGIFIEEEYLLGLKNFINSKYVIFSKKNKQISESETPNLPEAEVATVEIEDPILIKEEDFIKQFTSIFLLTRSSLCSIFQYRM